MGLITTYKLKKIHRYYGAVTQTKKLQEEANELLYELSRIPQNRELVEWEMADLLVMIEQKRLFYKIPKWKLRLKAVFKINRQLKRIKIENERAEALIRAKMLFEKRE